MAALSRRHGIASVAGGFCSSNTQLFHIPSIFLPHCQTIVITYSYNEYQPRVRNLFVKRLGAGIVSDNISHSNDEALFAT